MIYILAGVFSGAGCILMVAFPELALNAADRGLSLFLNSVLPSLLPFFICANFMIALGIPAVIGRYFEGLFRRVFRAPGSSAFVFVISVTSGYPMGAKLIGDMGRRGEISVLDGKRMLSFCTTSGPLFMLGTVGASMLGQSSAGVVIALSHYGAALLNGLLFRLFLGESGGRLPAGAISAQRKKTAGEQKKEMKGDILEEFTRAILSSFQTLGIICGYIVLFTLLTDFLQFSGALNLFDAAYQKGVAKGLLEMTVGAGSIAASDQISMIMKCALCSMLISFGGISIMAQSVSMLSGFDISVWYYLKVKIFHGLIAFGLALLLGPHLLASSVSVGAFGAPEALHTLGSFYGLLFSIKMVILVVILFFITCIVQNALDGFRRGMEKRKERAVRRKAVKEQKRERRKAAKIQRGERNRAAKIQRGEKNRAAENQRSEKREAQKIQRGEKRNATENQRGEKRDVAKKGQGARRKKERGSTE